MRKAGELGRRCRCRPVRYLNNIVEQDHRAIKRRVRAIQGFRAFRSAARTIQGIETMNMIRKGQIVDFEATSHLPNHFIYRIRRYNRLVHPRIVIGVPSEITPVERRAVKEACAKASEVHLVQQPVMAAVGAGLPIADPVGIEPIRLG